MTKQINQTALEFFITELIKTCGTPPENTWGEVQKLLEQAKKLEKQQICEAFEYALLVDGVNGQNSAAEYYEETYG